jgi:Domain of unknown function (DUF3854)
MSTVDRNAALTPEHAKQLSRFSIPPEMLEAADVRSVTDAEARDQFGINGNYSGVDLAGILFPYPSPVTDRRMGGRIRLDQLLPDGGKYLSEKDCRHLFFPPFPKEWLSDTSVPVGIVEAEKSALAVKAVNDRAGRRMLVIAIGGCWGWRRKIGKRELPNGDSEPETGPSKDFDLIAWQGRTVFLVFDTNASSNTSVQHARRLLAKDLGQRGALVQIAEVPSVENVNGPDDLIAVSGDDAMLRVVDSASPFSVITLRPGKRPDAVDQAEEILLGHSERFMIFQRASKLVRIVSLPEPRKEGGLQRSSGTVQLEPLSREALTEIFDHTVQWQRIGADGDERIIDCPAKIAISYLSRTGSWRLPVLKGIISAPIMREDGTILSQRGYDNDTGLFFLSDEDWPAIPDRPTREDARVALETLLAPFAEFPFVAAEDKAAHAAGILTAIQRRALTACPIFGYSAPAPRSGKTLLANSAAIIATGRPAPATTVSGEREEVRKVITSTLLEGHAVINFDNIERPLSSKELCIALTQQEYQDRVLGESRMLCLPTNVFWTATGNNLVFGGDLASRALLCRIDAGMESPESRNFTVSNLENSLRSNRSQLVAAALTILRAYHVAGRPKQHVSPWGGFDNWSANIREPLIWVGLADPCKTRVAVKADDPEREEWATGIRALFDVFGDSDFTTKEIIERCGSNAELKASILSVAAGRQQKGEVDSRRLGAWLKRVRDRIVGGLRLKRPSETSGVANWRITKAPIGGHGGHGGQFSGTENTTEPRAESTRDNDDSRQPETDPREHHDPQHEADEIVV